MHPLSLRGVRLDYPGHPGVLAGIDLDVPAGGLVVVQGRSGSGKSSLLALAAGLEEPTAGEVRVAGGHPTTQGVGLVFQHLNLLGELSVAENVALPLRLAHVPRQERQARTDELLERFGIARLAARRPGSLSGGEQQRVAIARALATRPPLLLVDEPTSNLDAENAASVVRALGRAVQEGAGVLVATHDQVFDRVGRRFELQAGRLVPA